MLFFVTSRYRLAVLPCVALFAGHGASTLVEWLRSRRWRRAGVAVAALVAAGILTRLDARPPRGARGWEQAQMAERRYALGDLDGAIRDQERAAALLPDRYEPALNLALYLSERQSPGDVQRAEDILRRLSVQHAGEAVIPFNLGAVLAQQGRMQEAAAAWREALRREPGFAPARSRLLQLGSPEPAP